jgi:hypothetical protein
MLKRLDTRVYNTQQILNMYGSLGLDLKLIGAPTPKTHSLDISITALVIK